MLLSVIIPVYNEEKTISKIVDLVKYIPLKKEIVIVNDGSKDDTAGSLRDILSKHIPSEYCADISMINQKNGGKGSALKTGIASAKGDIIIFQDADLEYDPKDYPAMIEPILKGRVKATMGSRLLFKKQNIWAHSGSLIVYMRNHLGVSIITWFTNLLYWKKATDYEGCYKAFDSKLLKSIPIETNGFDFDNELVCKIFRRGENIEEVPIHYYPRSYGEGKKIKFKDGIKILKTILIWRFKSF